MVLYITVHCAHAQFRHYLASGGFFLRTPSNPLKPPLGTRLIHRQFQSAIPCIYRNHYGARVYPSPRDVPWVFAGTAASVLTANSREIDISHHVQVLILLGILHPRPVIASVADFRHVHGCPKQCRNVHRYPSSPFRPVIRSQEVTGSAAPTTNTGSHRS